MGAKLITAFKELLDGDDGAIEKVAPPSHRRFHPLSTF